MRLYYVENDDFYKKLDSAVRSNEIISIVFQHQKLDEKAKLWLRLRECKNWSEMKDKLGNIDSDDAHFLKRMIKLTVAGSLIETPVYIPFRSIAVLAPAVALYAIYHDRKISLRVDATGWFAMDIS